MTEWDKFFDEKIKLIAKSKVILDAGGGGGPLKKLNAFLLHKK